jgi:hypothetical protein
MRARQATTSIPIVFSLGSDPVTEALATKGVNRCDFGFALFSAQSLLWALP